MKKVAMVGLIHQDGWKILEKKDYEIIEMDIAQGFIDYDNKISIYTDHEIFNRFHKKKFKQKFSNKSPITSNRMKDKKPITTSPTANDECAKRPSKASPGRLVLF